MGMYRIYHKSGTDLSLLTFKLLFLGCGMLELFLTLGLFDEYRDRVIDIQIISHREL